MKHSLALLLLIAVSTVGLSACVPAKAPPSPAIPVPVVQPSATDTVTKPYVVPDSEFDNRQPQLPQLPLPPSSPNPYLNTTQYHSWDYYYPPKPNNHYTPWEGGGFYYVPATVPPVSVGTPFWTGTATVTVN